MKFEGYILAMECCTRAWNYVYQRDGYDDIFAAAYTNSEGAPRAGKAYLYSGRSGALLRTFTSKLAEDNFGVDALSVGRANASNSGMKRVC